ncbi:MAG: Various polyols ABC transporter, permease protein 1, partial [uncultured Nocardioidaceae bacterium]
VEVHDVRPGLRHHQLRAGTLRRRRDRLGHLVPALVGDRGPGVAVDAVHDAPAAGRPDGPAEGRAGGGPGRRCHPMADIRLRHLAAPAPLHRAVGAARHALHRQHLRPDLHDDPGWTGHGELEPAVLHLPARVPRLRRRSVGGDGSGGRDRHHHRRDVRAATDLLQLPGRGVL